MTSSGHVLLRHRKEIGRETRRVRPDPLLGRAVIDHEQLALGRFARDDRHTFSMILGGGSTLDEKRRVMESFAENFIVKLS